MNCEYTLTVLLDVRVVHEWGATGNDLRCLYLMGATGNELRIHVNPAP
jgi:hypothetical protein